MNIANLTTAQLTKIISLKEQIESLQAQIESIAGGGGGVPSPFIVKPAKKGGHKMSAAGRARIIAAQKARWAKINAGKSTKEEKGEPKKRRKMSAAGRAKIAAAAKARWAKAKAEGKTTL